MKYVNLLFLFMMSWSFQSFAQCEFALHERDDFDSTLTIVSHSIPLGYKITSKYLTMDGDFTMIDEAKALFCYSEGPNNIRSYFLILGTAERQYLKIKEGGNVLLKLDNGKVLTLYNVPDRGEFDRKTNMRVYQHTCIVTYETYHQLLQNKIETIRINYEDLRKTLELSPDQQEQLLEAIKCMGDALKPEDPSKP